MCECPLSNALLSGLLGREGTPLNVAVTVTPSDQVTVLRRRVAELQAQVAGLQDDFNRAQYRYMCEVQLNWQLQDLLRSAGVSFPRRLCTTGTVPDDFKGYV